jgi:type I restriction enzyme S subunit
MALNGFPHVEAAVNEHVFILRTRNLHAQCFLYCFLRQQEIYERINTIASAKACQPGLNQSDVLNLEIELPTGDEIGRFEDKVISFFDEIVNLAKQSAALVAARDMLLPRLMKGQPCFSSL